jgi:hypothetical protein
VLAVAKTTGRVTVKLAVAGGAAAVTAGVCSCADPSVLCAGAAAAAVFCGVDAIAGTAFCGVSCAAVTDSMDTLGAVCDLPSFAAGRGAVRSVAGVTERVAVEAALIIGEVAAAIFSGASSVRDAMSVAASVFCGAGVLSGNAFRKLIGSREALDDAVVPASTERKLVVPDGAVSSSGFAGAVFVDRRAIRTPDYVHATRHDFSVTPNGFGGNRH